MIKPPSCSDCILSKISDGFSNPEGSGTSHVIILGEGLGYEEYLDGLPFRPHAAAGSKLEEIFRLASSQLSKPVNRSQFKIGNVIWCRPPGNELRGAGYERKAIDYCWENYTSHFLDKCLDNGNKVVLALGNIPLRELTGYSGIFEEKQSISHLRGFVYKTKYGLVVPTYHPAFLKRGNNHLTPIVVEDLIRSLKVASGEYDSYLGSEIYKAPIYQVEPSIDDSKSFYYKVKDSPKSVIGCDIETPETGNVDEDERDELASAEIIMVQFSIGKGTGIAIPFNGDYIPIIRDILELPNVKLGWNWWNFDGPRLDAKDIKVNGKIHDVMWMFKHWSPKLPRGLQHVSSLFGFPFPWKHLYGSNLAYYGCADVDSLHYIISFLPKLMKERGVWEGYKRHVLGIHPILERARERGIPVNEEKWLQVREEFNSIRKEKNNELQKKIPDEIRNITPKRVSRIRQDGTKEYDFGYVSEEPKILRVATERYEELCNIATTRGKVKHVSFETFADRKYNLVYAEFNRRDEEGVESNEKRWCVLKPFKGSKDQLVRYLKWKKKDLEREAEFILDGLITPKGMDKYTLEERGKARELKELAEGYTIPLTLKERKETTGKKELEEMFYKTGDEVIELVMRIRSLDTNLTNYIPNWKPQRDGRVHTTWGFGAPTGQKDSRRPNILNCSKYTEYGNLFRGIVEAPPGYTFVEFDKKSFHVATMGYCSNDRDYIRFSQIDPHSIFASYIDPTLIGGTISLKWTDEEIKIACKELKKISKARRERDPMFGIDVRQQLAKPTVLGNQLELGAKKLQRQNQRYIKTVEEAERYQEILRELFPKEEIYKRHIKEKAFLQTYLINEFGFIQYFFDIFDFTWSKKQLTWNKREGGGAREPIAFRVQGCAFGALDLEILETEEKGICERYNFVNTIHDSVIFMPETKKLDNCIADVLPIMNGKPCPLLTNESTGEEGLRVSVDVAVGRNWRSKDERENREGMEEIKI